MVLSKVIMMIMLSSSSLQLIVGSTMKTKRKAAAISNDGARYSNDNIAWKRDSTTTQGSSSNITIDVSYPEPTAFEVWGRPITWQITNFSGRKQNDDESSVPTYSVQAGENVNIGVRWTIDGTRSDREFRDHILQLYYGIDDVFCSGVFSKIANSREQGRNEHSFLAPNQPGIYSIRQSVSLLFSFDITDCGSKTTGNYEFAILEVLPSTNQPSPIPSLQSTTLPPTTMPTTISSNRPSIRTMMPTTNPTHHPSVGPSNRPTTLLSTAIPSGQPSRDNKINPITAPTTSAGENINCLTRWSMAIVTILCVIGL